MAANLRCKLGFKCICWNAAETVVRYSPLVASHAGVSPALIFVMKYKEE